LARTVGKLELHSSQKFISLEILVEDEDGEDVDVPSESALLFSFICAGVKLKFR
jgi:hypothetical protein